MALNILLRDKVPWQAISSPDVNWHACPYQYSVRQNITQTFKMLYFHEQWVRWWYNTSNWNTAVLTQCNVVCPPQTYSAKQSWHFTSLNGFKVLNPCAINVLKAMLTTQNTKKCYNQQTVNYTYTVTIIFHHCKGSLVGKQTFCCKRKVFLINILFLS